jgi:hypothetical protein
LYLRWKKALPAAALSSGSGESGTKPLSRRRPSQQLLDHATETDHCRRAQRAGDDIRSLREDRGSAGPSPKPATIMTRLAFARHLANFAAVWDQPYLETCCRAALHRLYLCGKSGRPSGLMDDPCQRRLAAMGLCFPGADGGFTITEAGQTRHASDILTRAATTTTVR